MSGAIVSSSKAERKFALLFDLYELGLIDEARFLEEYHELVFHDEDGARWMLGSRSRTWFRWDGSKWLSAWAPAALRFTPSPPVEKESLEPVVEAQPRRLVLTPLLLIVIVAAIAGAGLLAKTLVPQARAAKADAASATHSPNPKVKPKSTPGEITDSPPPPAPNQQAAPPFEVAGTYHVLIGERRGKDCASAPDLSEFIVSHSDVQILFTLTEHAIPGILHDDRSFDASASFGAHRISINGTFNQGDAGISIPDGVLLSQTSKGACTIHFTAAKM
ncbi:MAG: hypothetical protein ACYDCC_08680 [Actinomycetota bacterium]